jgi:hypothetical protein
LVSSAFDKKEAMCSIGIETGGLQRSLFIRESIARPLLREILKDIELSADELLAKLDKL